MEAWWTTLTFNLILKCIIALQLTPLPSQPTLGDDFSLTCTSNLSAVNFGYNIPIIQVCIVVRQSNGSCTTTVCNTSFNYTCNATTYTINFPGSINIDVYHGSRWICQDITGSALPSNPVTLHVTVPITNVSLTSNTTGIADGGKQTFTCTTDAGRPNAQIQWYLSDGTNLTVSAPQQTTWSKETSRSVLVYIGKLEDHGKTVHCFASNVNNRGVRSNDVTITIFYGPTSVGLTPYTLSYTVTETTDSVGPITCTADCIPNCEMTWSGPNLPDDTASVLNLRNINRNQRGNYRCTASNTVGSLESETVTITINYGPSSVLLYPTTLSYTVIETTGNVGPINCTANCNPNCIMTWSGPNLPAGTASVLHLQNINRNQSGDYRCNASNDFGNLTSKIVEVQINYGPSSILLSPSTPSYIVKETTGSVGPITCTADCRPNCEMTWSGPYLPGDTKSVLHLQNIIRNRTGEYQCTANNSAGNLTSGIVTVHVNYGPSAVLLSPPKPFYTVTETIGSVGPINCIADCRPDCKMTWSGPYLPGGTTSALHLQNITRNRTGEYQCTANNSAGSLTSEIVTVHVTYGPSSVLLIPYTPSYTVTEIEDSIGPITCTADCRPNCTTKWSGPYLPDGTTAVLYLQNITREQSGEYKCAANNSFGNHVSETVTVIVNYIPTIARIEGSNTYAENDTAKLLCQVDSNPKSTISWKFIDGSNITMLPIDSEPTIIVNDSILIVSQMSCLSMGLYICEASNGIGEAKKSLNITVTCAPKLNTIEYRIPNRIAVSDNQALNITVPVLAFPKPWVYWKFFKNDSITNITSENEKTFSSNRHFSTIYIENMTENEFGKYAIFAGNGVERTRNYIAMFIVQAARRPTKPSNLNCSVGYNYIILNWQPEFNGGSRQSFKVFYKKIQTKTFIGHPDNVSETMYHPVQIENLSSSSVYILKVNAVNIFNNTESDEINCNTTNEDIKKAESLIAVGAGTGVGAAAVVIILILIGLFMYRRRRNKETKNDKEPIKKIVKEEESDDLKDNPLYISFAEDVGSHGAIYDKSSKKNKQGKSNRSIEMACVYENNDDFLKGNDQIYANQLDTGKTIQEYKPTKNKDGLIYADLDFVSISGERKFIIHGMDNRNNYAIIDLSKKANPLPFEDEDDENAEKEK